MPWASFMPRQNAAKRAGDSSSASLALSNSSNNCPILGARSSTEARPDERCVFCNPYFASGVVVGLSVGIVSIVYHFVRELRGVPAPANPSLP